jgi:hypothetical protein
MTIGLRWYQLFGIFILFQQFSGVSYASCGYLNQSTIENRKSAIEMAERVGFEPTVPVRAHSISNAARSATLAPLLKA